MTNWSPKQRQRVSYERRILDSELPEFQIHNPNAPDQCRVEGWHKSNSLRNRYLLQLRNLANFPTMEPSMVVVKPTPLKLKDGSTIPNCSHSFHTLGLEADNALRICIVNKWNARMSFVNLFCRGILWVHCYERHLENGRDIEYQYKNLEDQVRQPIRRGSVRAVPEPFLLRLFKAIFAK
ncbi:MAG: hypothetical protein KC931_17265 [Candidatus Omnitrophica bacterium]|nr:hypothetical protein [Candidatus Omnitrophota bacterium]